ncbi:helix-turn-helix transcriptional regulator [Halobaculum roseum]|uniref:Helix-turn-helix transcriptional regulator n=1 Tax=Halobaculum roseum TaxID=2175149 RepID=A0ABD5MUD7_9EURY|nr:winged helix-turn-helix domain-containing protein [Halobaculum roseum]QZY04523.1 winged helix-turn-helix domain-containing protein [Halobaculum roseum]
MTGTHQTQSTTESAENGAATTGTATDGSAPDTDVFADLPPSAKLVHFVLDRDDQRTQTQLVEETALSARTVRTALGRLEDAGLVDESICLRDARKRVYSLTDDGATAGDAVDVELEV